jgi:hypothetical protein
MIEHPIYEFVAVDRPLTAKQLAEARAVSKHAEMPIAGAKEGR